MTDDLHSPLSTALQDRVRDEHPDLDELVRVSTARGSRLRRQRRAGATLGLLASAAAVSTCVVLLSGTGGGTAGGPAGDPGIATQPTYAPSGATREEQLERLQRQAQRRSEALQAPLTVTAAGWSCSDPADEKVACSRGAAFVSVNWRPADERDAYLDPGKADVTPGVHTFVSPAHGRWFATVSPGEGATQANVDQVAAGITWKD